MRGMTTRRRTTSALAGALTAATLVLTGCGEDSAGPETGAVTRVTGTVVGPIDPGVFEAEVGVEPDGFFAEPDVFFETEESLVAGLVADEVELLQAQAAE